MDTTLHAGPAARLPIRPIMLLALAALLITAIGIAVVGSLNRGPNPYGLADNGRIVYVQDGDLWARDTLGGEGTPLIATEDTDFGPYFAPDGTRFTFVREAGTTATYWVADADGTDMRPLLPGPIFGDGWMAWAADSRTIAVVNEVTGRPNLFLVDTDTGAETRLDLGILVPKRLAWRPGHPDTLLVQAGEGVRTDLYLVSRDGTDVRALGLPVQQTGFGANFTNSGGAWSLDGETIAYNAIQRDPATSSEYFRVAFVNPDGSGHRVLPGPANTAVQEAWPIYSPDGRWILVHRWTWKANDGGEGWLAVMPADGSEPARDIGPRIPGGEDTGLVATWSPDGSTVLMRSQTEQQAYEVDPVTGEWTELPWTDDLPDWQRVRR